MARKLFIILIAIAFFQQALQCHYSCSSCVNNIFSSCTSCANQEALLKPDGYSSSLIGACASININNANIFGIFLLLFMIATWIAFPSEEMIHFAILVQSLGLLYLMEVLWPKQAHYILSAFTYFMPFVKIEYAYNSQSGILGSFKQKIFFKTPDILANLSLIGAINLSLVLIMIVVPIFKAIRRRINKQRANCLPNVTLDKLMMGVNFIYLMMIQETMLSIYFGLKSGSQSIGGIALSVLYFLSLIFFIINQWFYPFPFFRSKFAQLNILVVKAIVPIFIVSDRQSHYIIFVLLIILLTVDLLITNKNRNNGSFNRLLLYKIYSLLTIIVLGGYYCIETIENSQSLSRVLGIICTLLLCGIIYLFLMEICIEWKIQYCNKKEETNQTIETTLQEFRVQKGTCSYDLNSMPEQKQASGVTNNSVFLFPIKNVSSNQLSAFVAEQSQKMENRSVKFTDKSSTNRFSQNLREDKNQQKIENFEEIQIKISERLECRQIGEQIIPTKTKVSDPSQGKLKSKKRRQRQ